MARPRRPSYRTCRLIYTRLQREPLWLEDWKSTGVNSRGTVYKALKYLYSKGLVSIKRKGHKKLYNIDLEPKNLLQIFDKIDINKPFHSTWSWYHHLNKRTKKEKRKIFKTFNENRTKLREMQEILKVALDQASNKVLLLNEEEFLESPECKDALKDFENAGIKWENIAVNQLFYLLFLYLRSSLCKECFLKGKKGSLVKALENNEIVCKECGVVPEFLSFSPNRLFKEKMTIF